MLEHVIHRLSSFLGILSAACIGVLMFSISLDVGRRVLVGRSIPGVLEYSESLMVALVFPGLAYAQRKGDHVSIDLVARRLPRRVSTLLYLAAMAVTLTVLVWMTIKTSDAAIRSIIVGQYRHGLLRVPLWPAKVVIPIGLSALILEVLVNVYRETKSLLLPQQGDLNAI